MNQLNKFSRGGTYNEIQALTGQPSYAGSSFQQSSYIPPTRQSDPWQYKGSPSGAGDGIEKQRHKESGKKHKSRSKRDRKTKLVSSSPLPLKETKPQVLLDFSDDLTPNSTGTNRAPQKDSNDLWHDWDVKSENSQPTTQSKVNVLDSVSMDTPALPPEPSTNVSWDNWGSANSSSEKRGSPITQISHSNAEEDIYGWDSTPSKPKTENVPIDNVTQGGSTNDQKAWDDWGTGWTN
eukprot:TRINITY_DN4342_c0_g2_i1.p1 TRINITY_DN4342_c0_g2~~TRINITY_DN4342_c0_g2_i1.p1  ORF type:complete len:236 (-),score=52.69 TRINITY_DN4342_c0_g2_i1:13-720(-)